MIDQDENFATEDGESVSEGTDLFIKKSIQDNEKRKSYEELFENVWIEGKAVTGKYGTYHKVKNIGQGGMGKVFEVKHEDWNKNFVVKIPLNLESESKFLEEVSTWLKIPPHPRIVSPYIVEFCQGISHVFIEKSYPGSLKEYLESLVNPISVEEIIVVGIQICECLEIIHAEGIIHRDIKPGNVLIGEILFSKKFEEEKHHNGINFNKYQIKLTDFGLAQIYNEGEKKFRGVAGTVRYMSPEQAKSPQDVCFKSDIYSLGVTLYEMMKKRDAPFCKIELTGIRDDCPEEVYRYIKKATAENKEERFDSASLFCQALKNTYKELYGKDYPYKSYGENQEWLSSEINNRGLAYLELNDRTTALNVWEESVKDNKKSFAIVYNMGLFSWRIGKTSYEEFIKQLYEIQLLSPDNLEHLVYISKVHIEMGDIESAEKVLLKANKVQSHIQKAYRKKREIIAHKKMINDLAIAKNGSTVISASSDTTLKIWNIDDERCEFVLHGHSQQVNSVCIDITEKYAFSVGEDGCLIKWDIATGRNLGILWEHDKGLEQVLINEFFLICFDFCGKAKVYDSSNCSLLKEFELGYDPEIVLVKDNIISITDGDTISFWKNNFEAEEIYQESNQKIAAICAIPQKQWIVLGYYSGCLKVFDLLTRKFLWQMEGHYSAITNIIVTTSENFAISTSADTDIRVWDLSCGRCIRIIKGNFLGIRALYSGNNDRCFFTAGSDLRIREWEVDFETVNAPFMILPPKQSEETLNTQKLYKDGIEQVNTFIKSDNYELALQYLKEIREIPEYENSQECTKFWKEIARKARKTTFRGALLEKKELEIKQSSYLVVTSLTGDGRFAAFTSPYDPLCIWDLVEEKCLHEYTERYAKAMFVGDSLIATLDEIYFKLWNFSTKESVNTIHLAKKSKKDFDISINGDIVVLGGDDLQIFNLVTGEELFKEKITRHRLRGMDKVVLSANCKILILNFCKYFRIFDLDSFQEIYSDKDFCHSHDITQISITADGKKVISSCEGNHPKVWDVEKGCCIGELSGHKDKVSGASISLDGKFAISSSHDKTLRLWNLETFETMALPIDCGQMVMSLAMSINNQTVVCIDFYQKTKIWYLDWDLVFENEDNRRTGILQWLEIFLSAENFGKQEIENLSENKLALLSQQFEYLGYGNITKQEIQKNINKILQNPDVLEEHKIPEKEKQANINKEELFTGIVFYKWCFACDIHFDNATTDRQSIMSQMEASGKESEICPTCKSDKVGYIKFRDGVEDDSWAFTGYPSGYNSSPVAGKHSLHHTHS